MTELQKFHHELMADVIAEATAAGGDAHPNAAFKENAFTRILLADLEAAGVLEAPTACYFANTAVRLPFKVNGYSFPDEEARLDIVVADFHPDSTVQKLGASDIDRCFKQALRFLSIAMEEGGAVADAGHEEHAMLREIFAQSD